MGKTFTHFGVYAILLIAVFYGSTSLTPQPEKTAQGTAITLQKAVTTAKANAQTASSGFYLSKNSNLKPCYSVLLQANAVIHATAVTHQNFFNHSATIQHHINTL